MLECGKHCMLEKRDGKAVCVINYTDKKGKNKQLIYVKKVKTINYTYILL